MNDQEKPQIDQMQAASKQRNLHTFEEAFLCNAVQHVNRMNYIELAEELLFLRRMYMLLYGLHDDEKSKEAMEQIYQAFNDREREAKEYAEQLEARYDTGDIMGYLSELMRFDASVTTEQQLAIFWDTLGKAYFNQYLSCGMPFLRMIHLAGVRYGKSLSANTKKGA